MILLRNPQIRSIRRAIGLFYTVLIALLGIAIGLIRANGGSIAELAFYLQRYTSISNSFWMLFYHLILTATLMLITFLLTYFIVRIVTLMFSRETTYIEPVKFVKPTPQEVNSMVLEILRQEKAKPEYVFVAPAAKEYGQVCNELKDSGIAEILDNSGVGKSMLAYHSAYREMLDRKFTVYQSVSGRQEYIKNDDDINRFLYNLDDSFGLKKLLIIDDSQRIQCKSEMLKKLEEEVIRSRLEIIWIEAESYETKLDPDESERKITINKEMLIENVVRNFYGSREHSISDILASHKSGLKKALSIARARKNMDICYFNYIVSQEETMGKMIDESNDTFLLVLFVLAVFEILSGEGAIREKYLIEFVGRLNYKWILEGGHNVQQAILSLEANWLIMRFDKSELDRGYIKGRRHIVYYTEVVKTLLKRKDLARDYLLPASADLLSAFNSNELNGTVNVRLYLSCVEAGLGDFVGINIPVFKEFILKCSSPRIFFELSSLLEALGKKKMCFLNDKDIIAHFSQEVGKFSHTEFVQLARLLNVFRENKDEILLAPVINKIIKESKKVTYVSFGQFAQLLNVLGDKKEAVFIDPVIDQLINESKKVTFAQFDQLVQVLLALGDKKEAVFIDPVIDQLINESKKVTFAQFAQFAYLIKALGTKKTKILEDKDVVKRIIKEAEKVTYAQLSQFATVLYAFGDKKDRILLPSVVNQIKKESEKVTYGRFDQFASLLRAVGDKKYEILTDPVIDQLIKESEKITYERFAQLACILHTVGDKKDEILIDRVIDQLVKGSKKVTYAYFDQLAHLLHALGDKKEAILIDPVIDQLIKESKKVTFGQFGQFAYLLDALGIKKNDVLEGKDVIERIAKESERITYGRFNQFASLLRAVGDKKYEILTDPVIDQLIKESEKITYSRFAQFSDLLSALGDKKEAILIDPVINQLVKESKKVTFAHLAQFSYLLRTVGALKVSILEDKDVVRKIKSQINRVSYFKFDQLADLLKHLDDKQKKEVIGDAVIEHFATEALGVRIADFDKLGFLLFELDENQRNKVMSGHVISKIIYRAQRIKIAQFDKLSTLLFALDRKIIEQLLSPQLVERLYKESSETVKENIGQLNCFTVKHIADREDFYRRMALDVLYKTKYESNKPISQIQRLLIAVNNSSMKTII